MGPPGKVAGPSFRLGGFETHQVDVAALQASQVLPKDAVWTSVILATNGLPEEVVALAASYDKTLRYGAQTPFSDQLAFEWVGSLWEYDVQHNSLITAGNGGTKPVQAGFTIYYNGGAQKYQLEQPLQPDEQMWIDVGKLIREQVPDKNGKLLPQDLTSVPSHDVCWPLPNWCHKSVMVFGSNRRRTDQNQSRRSLRKRLTRHNIIRNFQNRSKGRTEL